MPSPFPGMNPFIERPSVWHDFHERWIPLVADLIGAQVLPRYFVLIDEHLYIHDLPTDERRLIGRGDVLLPSLTPARSSTGTATGALLEAPSEVALPEIDTKSEAYLEIRDRENRELITVIELLSPTNKYTGPDREQYLAKTRSLQRSRTHFVEIDLLRGGPRMPWRKMSSCDYCAVVFRSERRPRAGFWPIGLRDRLPEIPIPLRTGDSDARLDLQQVLHRIYDAAGYAYHIYAGPPEPSLSHEDMAWAQQFVPTGAQA